MKHIFSLAVAVLLSFLVSSSAHARSCDPTPSPYWQDSYWVEWHNGTPTVFQYDYWDAYDPLLVAQFDRQSGQWVYYGWVPNNVVETVHREWDRHQQAYRSCLGEKAFRHTKYYFVPFHQRFVYRSSYHGYVPRAKVYRHKPLRLKRINKRNAYKHKRRHIHNKHHVHKRPRVMNRKHSGTKVKGNNNKKRKHNNKKRHRKQRRR